MIAVEIYLRSICFARMVWKIWHAHHVNQPTDVFSMIFPVNHPFWSILGIPMTMKTPILAAAIAVHSYAETCRSHWISDLYIYIITYTSTWVINDYAVWNAGPHFFFWRVSKMGTSDVSRNSLQLFESDPYGCHSQADPDRGWEIHSIDVPNSSKFPLVGWWIEGFEGLAL